MRKALFDFSEVALKQVETVYETIKELVSKNDYDSLKSFLNSAILSSKQHCHLLNELIDDNLFHDVKFAKIFFSSEFYYLNNDYSNSFGEPTAQAILYQISSIGSDLIYELFMDENSKINFKLINVNLDNVLQVLIDQSKNFTDEQFESLVKLLIYKKENKVEHKNDYDKNALELFLYRKKTNKNVFDILYKEYKKTKEESLKNEMEQININYEKIINPLSNKTLEKYFDVTKFINNLK